MAVWRRGEFGQHFPPPVAVGSSVDGQFERGFAAGQFQTAARPNNRQRRVPTPAFFQLAQSPLQQHAQVVSGDGQMVQGFRAPEVFHAQPLDPELSAQFLDPVSSPPAVVAAPYCQQRRRSSAGSLPAPETGIPPVPTIALLPPADGLAPAAGSRSTGGPAVPVPLPATASPGTSRVCHAAFTRRTVNAPPSVSQNELISPATRRCPARWRFETGVPAHQPDAHLGGQGLHALAQELRRAVHTRCIARTQPVVGNQLRASASPAISGRWQG